MKKNEIVVSIVKVRNPIWTTAAICTIALAVGIIIKMFWCDISNAALGIQEKVETKNGYRVQYTRWIQQETGEDPEADVVERMVQCYMDNT